MTKEKAEEALGNCQGFDISDASVTLWVFKKRDAGQFSSTSVNISEKLVAELRKIVSVSIQSRTEADPYSLLIQPSEIQALHVPTEKTVFGALKALVDEPADEHRGRNKRDLKNCAGYIIQLRSGGRVMYCVKRVPATWKTKNALSIVNVIFLADQLDIVEEQSFTIARNIDFVVLESDVVVFNKKEFEFLLSYKAGYELAFQKLTSDPLFVSKFTGLQPVIDHVGTNSMHLKRMAVIHKRGNFAKPDFMARLKQVNQEHNWNLEFDDQGRIIATAASMRTIMQVLLDHRLYSQLSLQTFDVPSTSTV